MRVEQVLVEGRRAVGVVGRVVAPFTGKPSFEVRVRARRVVLAAGCMATPVLLQKSGDLANASGQVGANLQFHPGVAMLGVFPDLVHPQFGATQGYQSLHFLREGFKLETLWAPPAVLAVRMPGAGLALKQRLALVPHSAVWDGIASCNRSLGTRARAQPRPGPEAHLEPPPGRRPDPRPGPPHARADLLRGRGAGRDPRRARDLRRSCTRSAEAEVLRTRAFRASEFVTGGNHAFCSTRMHGDPRRGVVDEFGRCHDLDGLYIADTGIFPQCPSVNPMWTGMALAHRTAEADRGRGLSGRFSPFTRLPGPPIGGCPRGSLRGRGGCVTKWLAVAALAAGLLAPLGAQPPPGPPSARGCGARSITSRA